MTDYIVAINDKRPGQEGFRVFGYLTVAHPGIEPILSESENATNGDVLRLDYVNTGASVLQVVTRKLCVFERKSGCSSTVLTLNTDGGLYRMPIITLE